MKITSEVHPTHIQVFRSFPVPIRDIGLILLSKAFLTKDFLKDLDVKTFPVIPAFCPASFIMSFTWVGVSFALFPLTNNRHACMKLVER